MLREMARRYSADQFKQLVDTIYRYVPTMSLSTDIIVGFPGETDDEFQETLDLAAACRFSKIHVFPYSMREGTPAAKRTDQVSGEVKQKRAARLRELSDELALADFEHRVGTHESAIIEPDFALTESYHEIERPAIGAVGDLVSVELESNMLRSQQSE